MTYTDYLVGLLLDKLTELKHDDDTVVALIGDHGWQCVVSPLLHMLFHVAAVARVDALLLCLAGCPAPVCRLGEHNIWGKHTVRVRPCHTQLI